MDEIDPSIYLPEGTRRFLRDLIIQAHEQKGPMSADDQERLVVELFLPTLRQIRTRMVTREELELVGDQYQVTGLVPALKPAGPNEEEAYVLRVGDLTVEWGFYGHTAWIWGDYEVAGGRHPGQFWESLQERMKRVEKWARGRSFTQEEFSAQVDQDEF